MIGIFGEEEGEDFGELHALEEVAFDLGLALEEGHLRGNLAVNDIPEDGLVDFEDDGRGGRMGGLFLDAGDAAVGDDDLPACGQIGEADIAVHGVVVVPVKERGVFEVCEMALKEVSD